MYAEGAREVAASLNVPAVDIWAAFMATVGWKEGQGQPLVGSRDLPNSDSFCSLFTDGMCWHKVLNSDRLLTGGGRAAFDPSWIPHCL